mgnify:CR=1 FL=1
MILTLDIGNSAVKGGLFDGEELVRVFRTADLPTEDGDAATEAWTQALRDHLGNAVVERAGLVSVVPDAVGPAQQALRGLTGAAVTVVSPEMPLPFGLAYETPETLGTDRLAAAAAAWVRFGRGDAPTGDSPDSAVRASADRSVLAVDAGTAVTYEVVGREGVYRGGVIGAGPALVQRALHGGTAQLPDVPLSFPDDPVGRSTESALQSGIMWGFIDGVRGMIDRLATTLPDDPIVVVTGGWSRVLSERLDRVDHAAPHLVLDGVRVLMEG